VGARSRTQPTTAGSAKEPADAQTALRHPVPSRTERGKKQIPSRRIIRDADGARRLRGASVGMTGGRVRPRRAGLRPAPTAGFASWVPFAGRTIAWIRARGIACSFS